MPVVRPVQPMRVLAHAKLNLGLEVIGRRADGYHDIVTIYQSISLADEIVIYPADEFSYRPIAGIEPDTDLVSRSLALLRSRWHVALRASVIVEKRIPLAAGLGGSSADGAAVLRTIAGLADISLGEVEAAGSELGSDVPFMIQGGTALGTGTGTTVDVIPTPVKASVVIVIPELDIPRKTATLYRSLREDAFSDGSSTLAQAERLRRGDPIDAQLIANPFITWLMQFPAFAEARSRLEATSERPAHVSGAGPAIYTICRDWEEAKGIEAEMTPRGFRALSCRTVGRS
ncbi:MAG TPA: 4-(cytidine 5'-diphospho)-2-C-methyl-D-erythritol kinase [Thermomicrobiaceae bacterium]|nr:4-(cytidine 5'-diphospho)-2-C-methyl-D-erythritol kinase [Thermomicrobiaceae bacterium]